MSTTDSARAARTFDDYAAVWIGARVGVRPSTLTVDRAMLKHASEVLGPVPVSKITPAHIDKLIATVVAKGLAPSSVRHVHRVARSVLKVAVRDRAVPRNVAADDIALPKMEDTNPTILTGAQVNGLADATDPRYAALIRVAYATGLRFGELAGLDRRAFNPLRGELSVTQQRTKAGGLAPIKTKAGNRTIALGAKTVETLNAHLGAYGSPGGVIFTGPNGAPLAYNNFRARVWLPATKTVGVEGATFHDLRHSHAAALIAAGEHPKVIQARLGHGSIRVTLDTYGHLVPGLDADAADAADAALYGVASGSA